MPVALLGTNTPLIDLQWWQLRGFLKPQCYVLYAFEKTGEVLKKNESFQGSCTSMMMTSNQESYLLEDRHHSGT